VPRGSQSGGQGRRCFLRFGSQSLTRRADAERNRDKILAAAHAAFADPDAEVPMAELSLRRRGRDGDAHRPSPDTTCPRPSKRGPRDAPLRPYRRKCCLSGAEAPLTLPPTGPQRICTRGRTTDTPSTVRPTIRQFSQGDPLSAHRSPGLGTVPSWIGSVSAQTSSSSSFRPTSRR
jgi:hypothetical protein